MKRAFVYACACALFGVTQCSFAALSLSQVWSRTAGASGETVITTGDNQRGLAYNPVTGNLYVADRSPLGVKVLNASTGALGASGLITTGISGGAITITKIAVADDGAIYATNLSTDGGGTSPFKIYRWADEATALTTGPTVVYDSTAAGSALRVGYRYGDNIDIKGSGTNTKILIGSGSTTQAPELALFSYNGTGFTADRGLITGSGTYNGGSRLGVAFGPSGAAFSKGSGALLYETYSESPMTPVVTASTPTSVVPSAGFPIEYDAASNLFAIVDTSNHAVRIFDASNPSVALTASNQLDLKTFGTANANTNGAGQVIIAGSMLWAMDTNNALVAYSIIPEPTMVAVLSLAGLALARRR